MSSPPRAIIFDIDGTLVDSNDAHAQAWVQALTDAGRRVPYSRVRPLIGKGADKLLPEVAGIDADSPEGKAIGHQCRRIFMNEFLPRLKPTAGAHALVEYLHSQDITLVVATSADHEEVSGLLKVADAEPYMTGITSSKDADRSKPDPDIVNAALNKAGVPREQVVMVGDTPYDIDAAHRAGIKVVALRSGGWWNDEQLADADAIFDTPADALQRFPSWW